MMAVLTQGGSKHAIPGIVISDGVMHGTALYIGDVRHRTGGVDGHQHASTNHSAKERINGMVDTNGIGCVWAVSKRCYNGISHSFSRRHLNRYVNELIFCLNNEDSSQIHLMERLSKLSDHVIGKHLTYAGAISNG
jgi:hypothetical protein